MAGPLGLLILLAAGIINVNGCPNQCTCTQNVVKCVNKRLDTLPEGIPADVSELYLSHNNLTSADLEKIGNFSNLTVLDMSYNNITVMKDGILRRGLHTLYLDYNQITFAAHDPFGNTESSLVRLSLGHNQISKQISIVTYFAHTKLQYLDLSYNKIASVVDNTIFPASLIELNLGKNPLERIYLNTLRLTTRLISLDLRDIRMTSMKSTYFKKCTSLRELRMGGKYLASISSITFRGLSSLSTLEISNSKLDFLPTQVFAVTPKLSILDLSGNDFDYFEDALFANDSELAQFYLYGNRGDMELNAKFFKDFRTLQYLSLAGNNITTFPSYLGKKLPKLKILDLSYNELTELQAVDAFESLVGLNVSYNGISNVTDDFFEQFPAILGVDLSKNEIVNLKPHWLKNSLSEVVTSNNSWACDCEMIESLSTSVNFPCRARATFSLSYSGSSATDREICILCTSPAEYEGKLFSNISNKLDDCKIRKPPPLGTTLPVSLLVAIIAAGICIVCGIVIAVLVLRRRKRSKPPQVEPETFDGPYNESSDRRADTSIYQQIPESRSNGYEYAMNDPGKDHVYCSVRQNKEAGGNARAYENEGEDAPAPRRSNLSVRSENPYVDEIVTSKPNANSGKIPEQCSRPRRASTDADAFQSLPPPPMPPTTANSNSLSAQSAYEIGMAARRTSYMDFCDPQSIAKNVRFQEPGNSQRGDSIS